MANDEGVANKSVMRDACDDMIDLRLMLEGEHTYVRTNDVSYVRAHA